MIYYCYDAYCGWCYGFSPVIKHLYEAYGSKFHFEVLSGGMILPEEPKPIGVLAGYISKAYKTVEEATCIKFGEDYLWHVFNPDKSDWFPHSEKPAIAMCVFKEVHADKQVLFASDLQYAHHYEGRDLTDDEAYRHLLEKYNLPVDDFYKKLNSDEYREKAYYEFAIVKQLQVNGFPTVFIQTGDTKFYILARGYVDFDTIKSRLEKILKELS
jgi:putative protein-disulfide isomerase